MISAASSAVVVAASGSASSIPAHLGGLKSCGVGSAVAVGHGLLRGSGRLAAPEKCQDSFTCR